MEDDSSELTEKEWREMRRRMTSLQFDPVPETPALLPRSLYGEADVAATGERAGDDASRSVGDGFDDEGPPPSPPLVLAMLESSSASHRDADPQHSAWETRDERRSPPPSPISTSAFSSPPAQTTKSSFPLSRASLKSSKRRPSAPSIKKTRRPSASNDETGGCPDSSAVDLSELESTIVHAQDQLRLTVLTAVHEATSRHEREAALERRKLEAAHANRIATMQQQIDELVAASKAHQQRTHDDTEKLERATQLMLKWKQRERERNLFRTCFGAWSCFTKSQQWESAREQLVGQFQKKQAEQNLFQQWKLVSQQHVWEKMLQALKAEHRDTVERMMLENADKHEQLQRELEAARQSATVAETGRQQLEGDLRQVFLRGVSAMNIEALTLFKTNHQILQQRDQDRGVIPQHQPQDAPRSQPESREPGTQATSGSPSGGESSEELPSDERMIPFRQPVELTEDPRARLQSLLVTPTPPTATGVMPSFAMANNLLRNAGSAEVAPAPSTDTSIEAAPSPPPTTASFHGLRSAELVEAHQRLLHATAARQPPVSDLSRASFSVPPGRNLSPAKQRAKVQSSMQFNVEMELVRSSVASAAALNSRYPVGAQSTRSSATFRATSTPPSTRRASSFSSASSTTKGKWRS